MTFILKAHANKNTSVAKFHLPPPQHSMSSFYRTNLTHKRPSYILQWDSTQPECLQSCRWVKKTPPAQSLENQPGTAPQFLGKLMNEHEKALELAKITYKKPCESFPPGRREGRGENVPHHTANGASICEFRVRFSVGGILSNTNTCPSSSNSELAWQQPGTSPAEMRHLELSERWTGGEVVGLG